MTPSPGRPSDWSGLLAVPLDRETGVPIFRQLFREMTAAILDGRVPPGGRLPATRALAAKLGISRTCVVSVYEQLLAEGYAEGRAGSGTFVSRQLLIDGDVKLERPPPPRHRGADTPTPAARYARLKPDYAQFDPAPFNTGRCTLDERTLTVWRRLTATRLRRSDPQWLGYSDPCGSMRLREALATYLRVSRGVQCDPAQIMILSGTQQAIDLVIKILVEPGTPIWIEDPVYPALHAALLAAQSKVVPVPVDDQGLIVAEGIRACPAARAAYVTPSHQSPSGVVMSMARRLELLAWARDTKSWIIEDDYDSEFRYAGRPLASLQGIDTAERVIYMGTFSKVIYPGLRLGYAVIPYELLDAMVSARHLTDRHAPALTEAIVADFMEQGHFSAHLRRMCAQYREARDHLVGALQTNFGEYLEVDAPDQGMHLKALLRPGIDDARIARAGLQHGVVLRPMSKFYVAALPVSALMLGFTGYNRTALQAGITRLGTVFGARDWHRR